MNVYIFWNLSHLFIDFKVLINTSAAADFVHFALNKYLYHCLLIMLLLIYCRALYLCLPIFCLADDQNHLILLIRISNCNTIFAFQKNNSCIFTININNIIKIKFIYHIYLLIANLQFFSLKNVFSFLIVGSWNSSANCSFSESESEPIYILMWVLAVDLFER